MNNHLLTLSKLDLRIFLANLDGAQAGYVYKELRWLDTFAALVEDALDEYLLQLDNLERHTQREARVIRMNAALEKDVKEMMLSALYEGYNNDVAALDETEGENKTTLHVPEKVFNFIYEKWTAEEEEVDMPDRSRQVRARKFTGGRAVRKLRTRITNALEAAKEAKEKVEDEGKE